MLVVIKDIGDDDDDGEGQGLEDDGGYKYIGSNSKQILEQA